MLEYLKDWRIWLLCVIVVIIIENPIAGFCQDLETTKHSQPNWNSMCSQIPRFEEPNWTPFLYKPEKSMEDKFKKNINFKPIDNLKFTWKQLDAITAKYKFNDSLNATWAVQSNMNNVALLTFEW